MNFNDFDEIERRLETAKKTQERIDRAGGISNFVKENDFSAIHKKLEELERTRNKIEKTYNGEDLQKQIAEHFNRYESITKNFTDNLPNYLTNINQNTLEKFYGNSLSGLAKISQEAMMRASGEWLKQNSSITDLMLGMSKWQPPEYFESLSRSLQSTMEETSRKQIEGFSTSSGAKFSNPIFSYNG